MLDKIPSHEKDFITEFYFNQITNLFKTQLNFKNRFSTHKNVPISIEKNEKTPTSGSKSRKLVFVYGRRSIKLERIF